MIDPDLQQKFRAPLYRCRVRVFHRQHRRLCGHGGSGSEFLVERVAAAGDQAPTRAAAEPVELARAPGSRPPPTPPSMPLFNPFAWMLPPPPPPPKPAPAAMPTNPFEAMAAFANAMSGALSAMSATPVRPLSQSTNPMMAWLTTLPFASAPASWPMAFMMMSSGVPHAVAWPTAEANAAVMDAADAATQSIKKVFTSYHTEGAHAASRGPWPPTNMLTLMAMVPMNVGTMFTARRLS